MMQAVSDNGPRIAFTTTVYDHTDVGGGTFVHYLRRAVEDGRLDLVFFSDDMQSASASYERQVRIPAAFKRLPGGWLNRAYFLHKAVLAEHRKHPFDLIWHNNVITSLVDVTRGVDVPVVGMINDYNNAESRTPLATRGKFGGFRAFIRFGWHQFERYTARRVGTLIVNSEYMTKLIQKAYGVSSNRVRLLYKGVDLDEFEFSPLRTFAAPLKILFVKQDFVRGGLWDLMSALSAFPREICLTVVGPPVASHDEIIRAAERAGIAEKMKIIGPVSRDEIVGYFKHHHVMCIPSRSEALGVAFMEALASGIPAVGTNVGGIPEVLDYGKAGWLAEPGDPASIRSALIDVVENEGIRETKINHGRTHVGQFSHNHMVDEMRTIARSITEASKECV